MRRGRGMVKGGHSVIHCTSIYRTTNIFQTLHWTLVRDEVSRPLLAVSLSSVVFSLPEMDQDKTQWPYVIDDKYLALMSISDQRLHFLSHFLFLYSHATKATGKKLKNGYYEFFCKIQKWEYRARYNQVYEIKISLHC